MEREKEMEREREKEREKERKRERKREGNSSLFHPSPSSHIIFYASIVILVRAFNCQDNSIYNIDRLNVNNPILKGPFYYERRRIN